MDERRTGSDRRSKVDRRKGQPIGGSKPIRTGLRTKSDAPERDRRVGDRRTGTDRRTTE